MAATAEEGERILVTVRVRPLNDKERAKNEASDWQCIGNTVMYNQPDRASSPSAYAFDRVFGNDLSTKHVYEEGAKEVALSVVNGINSTIFAYGQTSSGKTYTMNGVTQYAVGDPSDFLYLEVELRRLIALYDTFNGSSAVTDRHAPTSASSLKALKKEREMLSKKVHKRFSGQDRERLYQKWGIRLNTKERSLQLTNYLWTRTMDMGHIRESAALVAKLIVLTDQPLQAPKEILGISFLSQPVPKKASFWRDIMSTL